MELWGGQEISWELKETRGGKKKRRKQKKSRLDDYGEFLLFCKPHSSSMGMCWRSVIHQRTLRSSVAVWSALCHECNAQDDTLVRLSKTDTWKGPCQPQTGFVSETWKELSAGLSWENVAGDVCMQLVILTVTHCLIPASHARGKKLASCGPPALPKTFTWIGRKSKCNGIFLRVGQLCLYLTHVACRFMKCKAIPGLDTEEKCFTCQDKASTMWHVGAEGRSLSFEFFLITIPTLYLMLYLRRSCVTPWECIYAFPGKVRRRDGVQRTPPKSCTTRPGICSGRTLGVHPVLHRYHRWSKKISK